MLTKQSSVKKEIDESLCNNGGFTLVELIVAVAILAAVFTPVLKSFMTASIVNSKAQIKQNATSLAESVMEDVKGKTIQQLHDEVVKENADAAAAGNTATMSFAPLEDGNKLEAGKLNNMPPYTITYREVTATQGQKYNVDVTISTDEYSDTSRSDERKDNKKKRALNPAEPEDFGNVSDANLVEIPKLSEIDSARNAVLSWEINEYDGVSFEALLDKNVTNTTGEYWDDTSWWGGIRQLQGNGIKNLKVKIDNSGTDDIRVSADVTYDPKTPNYEPITYSVYDSKLRKDEMQDIYIFYTCMKDDAEARKRQEEADGHSVFYMFYLGKENVEIVDNSSGCDFRVFFVMQNIDSQFEVVSTVSPTSDKLVVKDKKGGEATVTINNLSMDSGKFMVNGHRMFTNFEYTTLEDGSIKWVPDNLYETESKEKVYFVTVTVSDLSGKQLATLTSTMPTGNESY